MRSITRQPLAKRFQTAAPGHQEGVALIIALLILVVVTLVGLASIRGTVAQFLMTANFYDRETAMQSAEAAIRVAQAQLLANAIPSADIRDCSASGANCTGNPFTEPANNLPANAIQTVAAAQYTASAVAVASPPQYIVENMGIWADPNSNTGFNQTANSAQYGAQGLSTTATYYRITVRSADPTQIGNRSVVTLQAMVKQ